MLSDRLKNGDVQALRELYEQYWVRLFNLSYKYLQSKEEAEESVQDIFLKVWEKRHTLKNEYSLKSFLFTITKNHVLNLLRKRTLQVVSLDYNHENSYTKTLEDDIIFQELEELSDKVINKFPERRRKIYHLSRKKGLTNQQVAAELGISVKVVEKQIGLALKSIRKFLENYSGNTQIVIFIYIELFL